jgi:asparaginyl-tRNA synthetase
LDNSLALQKFNPPRSWSNTATHYQVAMSDPWYKALTIIQDEINHSSWHFFRNKGIRTVSLPITTGSVTSPMGLGSDSLPVKINLEGIDTYLSDSMQFHLEYALRTFEGGVHYIMPSFRGEKADKRHLCQFYHSEAEIIGSLEDVISLVNSYIHHLCKDLMENIPEVIKSTAGTLDHVKDFLELKSDYPRLTLEEAIMQLKDDPKYVQHHQEGFRTLTHEGERKLIDMYGGIVWVTHHEYMSVPFYQAATPDLKCALNGDLLFGIGEVVGSGQRHISDKDVKSALNHHQVSEDHYEWYIKMKELNPLQSSGFGMGIERFILWLTKHDDIRDCQLIPRFNGELINP